MSRTRRLLHSLFSGYAALVFTALFSLASVPLAFRFLDKDEFALWALASTVAGYFGLLDLGISGAMSRLLVDVKDQKNSDAYGSLVKTGWVVSMVQGVIVLILGLIIAPTAVEWLAINPDLKRECTVLIRWQCAAVAFGFAVRIFNQLLQAHQRIDLFNYAQVAALLLNFVTLWVTLKTGWGVYSAIWANWIALLSSSLLVMIACWRLGYFPEPGFWGHVTKRQFNEVFAFGKDIFFIVLGTQVLISGQAIVITRRLGLEEAAVWVVGTKLFNLIFQVIWRISDFAAPALSEMIVRGERERLKSTYRSLFILTASISALFGVFMVLCNSLFVTLWTHGEVSWDPGRDFWLAIWLFTMATLRCHNGFILITKEIRSMHLVYLTEVLIFCVVAWLFAKFVGTEGVIIASFLCGASITGYYGMKRVSEFLGESLPEVGARWLMPMCKMLFLLIIMAAFIWWVGKDLAPLPRFVLNLCSFAVIASFLFARFGLSPELKMQISERVKGILSPLANWFLYGARH